MAGSLLTIIDCDGWAYVRSSTGAGGMGSAYVRAARLLHEPRGEKDPETHGIIGGMRF